MGSHTDEGPRGTDRALFGTDFLRPFCEAFNNVSIGIIVTDADGLVEFFNTAAERFLGLQPLYSIGRSIWDIIPENAYMEGPDPGAPFYDKTVFINGVLLRYSFIHLEDNGVPIANMGIVRDSKDRLFMESELAEVSKNYEHLEWILDNAFEEFKAVDENGRFRYLSRKSAENLGASQNELLGKDMKDVDPNPLLRKVLKTGTRQVGAISRLHREPIPMTGVPLIKNGDIAGALFTSSVNDMSAVSQSESSGNVPGDLKGPKKTSHCKFSFADIIGKSRIIANLKKKALRIAQGDSTVLITGESGTGKELFAQAIHSASLRRNAPFIRVNCGSIPETLLESELFGYEPGSFTGADRKGRRGKFEIAHNGTLFLDEAGDMSLGMQAKILRVIQDGEFERIGGAVSYEVDLRFIAATNKDLWNLVATGKFREDLYYRLDVVNIHIPPLRERPDDIPFLIDHLIPIINQRVKSSVIAVSDEALRYLKGYDWPGNVRELGNVLEGVMNLNSGEAIRSEALPPRIRRKASGFRRTQRIVTRSEPLLPFGSREAVDKAMIEQALFLKGGNKRQAALYLNMPRSTFYNKLKKYRINTELAAEALAVDM